jgi:hypothetical protein
MILTVDNKQVNGCKKNVNKIYINTLVPNFQYRNKLKNIVTVKSCVSL